MGDQYIFMWRLVPGEKVSEAIVDAAVEFELDTGIKAEFAFIRRIPQGAEEFAVVKGITLVQAGWVPKGQVVISGMGLGFDTPKGFGYSATEVGLDVQSEMA